MGMAGIDPYRPDFYGDDDMRLFDTLPRPLRDEINAYPWDIEMVAHEWERLQEDGSVTAEELAERLRHRRRPQ